MLKSRDLTLFRKGLITKAEGLSLLMYSASNIDVPIEVTRKMQGRLFKYV